MKIRCQPSGMRIGELVFTTHDPQGTLAFYAALLGDDAVAVERNCVRITAGASVLKFRHSNLPAVYHFAFNIPWGSAPAALEYVRSRAKIIRPPGENELVDFSRWNALSFYFFDNGGNVVEYIARRDLPERSNGAFDRNVISVSEVGLVTGNVKGTVESIGRSTGITPYEKQPVLENFAALGDEHGLLILSKQGRSWFPTEILSERFPLRLRLSVDNKSFWLNEKGERVPESDDRRGIEETS